MPCIKCRLLFKDSSHFYLLISSKEGSGQGFWTIKRVVSSTFYFPASALVTQESVPGQTEVLWTGSTGWKHNIAFKFNILHLPAKGLIQLKIYEGATLVEDSGDIIDKGEERLSGGKMGVFCYSQASITWSALSYRCATTTISATTASSVRIMMNRMRGFNQWKPIA